MNKLQLILLMIASVVIIAAALLLMSQPAYANRACDCQTYLYCSCDGIWYHGIQYPCGGRIYCPTWPHQRCHDPILGDVFLDEFCRE